MARKYESPADRAIREAQERGEFDNLPGAGKPIPGLDGRHDPDWWIKSMLEREQVTGVLPPSLTLRKQIDGLQESIASESSERNVRAVVDNLNQLITQSHRRALDGPQIFFKKLDPDAVVGEWKRSRTERGRYLRP